MIYYKNSEEIEHIKESSLIVAKALAEVARIIKPGVTTHELDKRAETCIRDLGAIPAFKGYRGFPATLCVSINECVVHGIPSDRVRMVILFRSIAALLKMVSMAIRLIHFLWAMYIPMS